MRSRSKPPPHLAFLAGTIAGFATALCGLLLFGPQAPPASTTTTPPFPSPPSLSSPLRGRTTPGTPGSQHTTTKAGPKTNEIPFLTILVATDGGCPLTFNLNGNAFGETSDCAVWYQLRLLAFTVNKQGDPRVRVVHILHGTPALRPRNEIPAVPEGLEQIEVDLSDYFKTLNISKNTTHLPPYFWRPAAIWHWLSDVKKNDPDRFEAEFARGQIIQIDPDLVLTDGLRGVVPPLEKTGQIWSDLGWTSDVPAGSVEMSYSKCAGIPKTEHSAIHAHISPYGMAGPQWMEMLPAWMRITACTVQQPLVPRQLEMVTFNAAAHLTIGPEKMLHLGLTVFLAAAYMDTHSRFIHYSIADGADTWPSHAWAMRRELSLLRFSDKMGFFSKFNRDRWPGVDKEPWRNAWLYNERISYAWREAFSSPKFQRGVWSYTGEDNMRYSGDRLPSDWAEQQRAARTVVGAEYRGCFEIKGRGSGFGAGFKWERPRFLPSRNETKQRPFWNSHILDQCSAACAGFRQFGLRGGYECICFDEPVPEGDMKYVPSHHYAKDENSGRSSWKDVHPQPGFKTVDPAGCDSTCDGDGKGTPEWEYIMCLSKAWDAHPKRGTPRFIEISTVDWDTHLAQGPATGRWTSNPDNEGSRTHRALQARAEVLRGPPLMRGSSDAIRRCAVASAASLCRVFALQDGGCACWKDTETMMSELNPGVQFAVENACPDGTGRSINFGAPRGNTQPEHDKSLAVYQFTGKWSGRGELCGGKTAWSMFVNRYAHGTTPTVGHAVWRPQNEPYHTFAMLFNQALEAGVDLGPTWDEAKWELRVKACLACKPGGDDGGVELVGGRCMAYCSRMGYCGSSREYESGIDCRRVFH